MTTVLFALLCVLALIGAWATSRIVRLWIDIRRWEKRDKRQKLADAEFERRQSRGEFISKFDRT